MEGRPPPPAGPSSPPPAAPGATNNGELAHPPHTSQPRPFAGYTPEMLRQAQIQMQMLQQMRSQQPPYMMMMPPPGGRPSMTPSNGNATAVPNMGAFSHGMRLPPTRQPAARPPSVPMPAVSKATLPQQTPGLFRLPPSNLEMRSSVAAPALRSPSLNGSGSGNGGNSPVLPSPNLGASAGLPIFSRNAFASIPPYDAATMDESAFIKSLSRFMYLVNCPIKKIPLIRPDKQLPLLRLFQLATTFGGFKRVNEGNRWTAIAVSLEMSPITPETVSSLQRLYATLLYAYEQVYFLKIPLDKVIWPQQVISHMNALCAAQQSRSAASPAPSHEAAASASNPAAAPDPAASPPPVETKEAIPTQVQAQPHQLPQAAREAKAGSAAAVAPVKRLKPPSDSAENVYRLARRIKKINRSALAFGRISYEELILMLSSGQFFLESAALLLLERISFDAMASIPSSCFSALLDSLTAMLVPYIERCRETCSGGGSLDRPFDYLLRVEEAKTNDLLVARRPSGGRIEAISNILKNLLVHEKEGRRYQQLMAKRGRLLDTVVLPLLVDPLVWQGSSLEFYSNCWFILLQLLPAVNSLGASSMAALLRVSLAEVSFCIEHQLHWAHILHEKTIFETPGESQRIISRFISMIPSRCFLLIDLVRRLVELGGGSSSESQGVVGVDAEDALGDLLASGLQTLWRALQLLLPIAYGHLHHAREALASASGSSSYGAVLGSYLHNVNISLTDGGYLELILLTMERIIRRLPPERVAPLAPSLVGLLVRFVDAVRFIYVQFAPPFRAPYLPELQEQSRSLLLLEPIATHHSHPHMVFLMAVQLLGRLADSHAYDELGGGEVEILIGWLMDDLPGAHADVVRSDELRRLAHLLL